MPATHTPWTGSRPRAEEVERALRDEGREPRRWANAPGDTYGWHSHGYRKIVACLTGSIVFHTRDSGDVELRPGDRLVIEPGTDHAATVGDDGVECAEAHARP